MLNRENTELTPGLAFDALEKVIPKKNFKKIRTANTLHDYIVRLARLDGFLARKRDAPPGHTVIWSDLNICYEFRTGMELANFVSN